MFPPQNIQTLNQNIFDQNFKFRIKSKPVKLIEENFLIKLNSVTTFFSDFPACAASNQFNLNYNYAL